MRYKYYKITSKEVVYTRDKSYMYLFYYSHRVDAPVYSGSRSDFKFSNYETKKKFRDKSI